MKAVKIILVSLLLAGVAVFVHSCKKKEKEYSVLSVSLDQNEVKMGTEETLQLVCEVKPLQAKNHAVKWTSSNTKVAVVDEKGLVTSLKLGQAIITVTTVDGGKTDTCLVTISDDVNRVVIEPKTLDLVIDENFPLKATVYPAKATNKKVTWESTNPSIASIDANGKVKGLIYGEAAIVVTTEQGSYTDTCWVKVDTVAPAEVESVSLDKTSYSFVAGGSYTLKATVLPADARQTVTWTSSNPDVVMVDANGGITSAGKGSAVVTVTTTNGNKTATCNVTVDKSIYIMSSGQVYRNSKQIFNSPSGVHPFSMYKSGTDIYRGGYYSSFAKMWKNNAAISPSSDTGRINSVFVSSGYVYGGGSSNYHACLWVNGIKKILNNTSTDSDVNSVVASGSTAFAVGELGNVATLWVRNSSGGVSTYSLPVNGTVSSVATAAVIYGNDLYIVGYNVPSLFQYDIYVWKCSAASSPGSISTPITITHGGMTRHLFVTGGNINDIYIGTSTQIYKGTTALYSGLSDLKGIYVDGTDVYYCRNRYVYKNKELLYSLSYDANYASFFVE